jgi:hypothetical protein
VESAVFRDWVIIIGGSLMIILFILILVLAFILFRQINNLTTTVLTTIKTARETSEEVRKAFKSSNLIFKFLKEKAFKGESSK